jgi:hypothetical protein
MSKTSTVALATFGVLLLFIFVFIGSLLSFRTQAVNFEESIRAQYTQNQNNYDNMWKKFKEMAQVTDKFADDLKELYDNAMEGRYGGDGSQAMFQWITEQNPNLSPETYTRLQSTIEASRNSFQSDQKQLISKKESYQKLLRSNGALVYNVFLGFPKIDMAKFSIVTSEETDRVFESKKAEEVTLF